MSSRRHQVVLSLGIVLGLLSGLGANTIIPEIYSGTASIKIGKIRVYPKLLSSSVENLGRTVVKEKVSYIRSRPIERREDLEFMIREKFRVPAARLGKVPLPYIFSTDTYEGDIVTFSARGGTKEEVRQKLDQVITFVRNRHDAIYDAIYREHWRELERILETIDNRLAILDKKETQSSISQDETSDASGKERFSEVALFEAYSEISLGISAAYSERTWVLLPPTVDHERVQPKLLSNLLTGTLSGLAFAFIMLGFLEFLRRYRQTVD